ncbi:hypothetical protein DFQ27_009298 [Actinomortierella ambigua]|uniref:Uncharacterized protein n=1 Tax=Actinomortierella ambigua TaxID=1343610 RepID=A0A9P6QFV0_9FUNG|nr:hypothetical protein DFQ27_009298 [Actinomortierella ambigua]
MGASNLQKFIRMAIAGLAFVCLTLDCIHIHQLRRAWKGVRYLPYQDMEVAEQGQLEVYYAVLLLLPDLLAVLMYAILIVSPRPCTDKLYHFIHRVLWVMITLLVGWWYPIVEIRGIQRHAAQMEEQYGCQTKTPTALSEYFCFAGYPNDYSVVYGTEFDYLDSQDAEAAQWRYAWLEGYTITCGVYRTRHFLWLTILAPLMLVELVFGFLSGELSPVEKAAKSEEAG